jgi:hypothetical protein
MPPPFKASCNPATCVTLVRRKVANASQRGSVSDSRDVLVEKKPKKNKHAQTLVGCVTWLKQMFRAAPAKGRVTIQIYCETRFI